jgi:hypothetical protein
MLSKTIPLHKQEESQMVLESIKSKAQSNCAFDGLSLRISAQH